jgi:hypothetical protein
MVLKVLPQDLLNRVVKKMIVRTEFQGVSLWIVAHLEIPHFGDVPVMLLVASLRTWRKYGAKQSGENGRELTA